MHSRADASLRTLLEFAAFALAGVFYLTFILRGAVIIAGAAHFTLFDDAMISMRYAQSLANGGGLTWNPGDTPVEGVTNLLWTLWMAVLHLAPVPPGWVPALVSLSSAACLVAAAVGAQRLAKQLGGPDWVALAALLVTLAYYPLAFWSLRGMETGVLAALMTWSMVLGLRELDAPLRRRRFALFALAAALVLVRQDALVFLLVLSGYLTLRGLPKRQFTGPAVLATTLATLAALTVFRWSYFGGVTPNTYTLKVTGVTLAERLGRGFGTLFDGDMIVHFGPIAAVLLLAIPALRSSTRALLVAMALPLAAFAAQCAYSVFVGGDVWEDLGYPNRFLVVTMPGLLALTLVALWHAVQHFAARARATLFAAAALLLGAALALPSMIPAVRGEAAYVAYDRAAAETGVCLRDTLPKDASIAVVWAGTMAYYGDRFAIDLLGKMDRAIARSAPRRAFLPGHNKWDYAYSLDTYEPDFVLQVWGGRDHDRALIRARGYLPVGPKWRCFGPGFLVPGQVYAKPAR
jgi:hypothetical protein